MIARLADRAARIASRLVRAWRYRRALNYSWRHAWASAYRAEEFA